MKVILSVDPVKFPLTGIGRYTYELGKSLRTQLGGDVKFLQGNRLRLDLPQVADTNPMATIPSWRQLLQGNRTVVDVYRRLNSRLKERSLRGLEDHVFHGPNYYLPPFGGKSVVTIHDLSHCVWTQGHPPERVRYLQAEMELSLARASALITDTEYTRQEVARYFSWPLNKIHAVHLASGPEFAPRSDEELAQPLAAHGLVPDSYTLFTGTVEPRKNIGTLLDAYSLLPAALRRSCPLVVCGYRGWQSDALHLRLKDAEAQGWVKYLGFVSNEMLPLLMAGARLFAYPSLYEGFGLPVLEAMASGVPVVCSNATTLPEVSGSAAAMHDPNDADTLLDHLQRGLEDDAWRHDARERGLVQASRFSWDRCARETMAVYETVTNGVSG